MQMYMWTATTVARQSSPVLRRAVACPGGARRNVGLSPPTWPRALRWSSTVLCSPPSLAVQGTLPHPGLTGLGAQSSPPDASA